MSEMPCAPTCTIREAVERFGLDRATVRRLRKRLAGKQRGWRSGHGWNYTLRDLEEALEDDRASQWRRSWPVMATSHIRSEYKGG